MANPNSTVWDLSPVQSVANTDRIPVQQSSSQVLKYVTASDFIGVVGKTMVTVGGSEANYLTSNYASDGLAIQAAIDAVNALGGGAVLVKAGTYTISTKLNLCSNLYFMGEGVATVFDLSSGIIIEADDKSNIILSSFKVDSLDHVAQNKAIRINDSTNILIEKVYADARAYAIFLESNDGNTERVTVRDCNLNGRGNNDVIGGGPYSGGAVKNVKILDNYVTQDITLPLGSAYGGGIILVEAQDLIIKGNHVKGAVGCSYEKYPHNRVLIADNRISAPVGGTSTYVSVDAQTASSDVTEDIVITHNIINVGRILVYGNTTANVEDVIISENKIKATTSLVAIDLLRVTRPKVLNNTVRTAFNCVKLDYCDQVVVVGNSFIDSTSGVVSTTNATANNCIIHSNYFDTVTNKFPNYTFLSGSIYNNQDFNPWKIYAQGDVTGATTFDNANGNLITATLTGNITVTLSSGKRSGDRLILRLTQDATGSRLVTWPATFKKAGGTLTLSTGANAIDVIEMVWDQAHWKELSRSLNVS